MVDHLNLESAGLPLLILPRGSDPGSRGRRPHPERESHRDQDRRGRREGGASARVDARDGTDVEKETVGARDPGPGFAAGAAVVEMSGLAVGGGVEAGPVEQVDESFRGNARHGASYRMI